eukprot:2215442-Amphidinium_carterae.2
MERAKIVKNNVTPSKTFALTRAAQSLLVVPFRFSLASITAKSAARQAASHFRAPRDGVRKGEVNSQPKKGLKKSELIVNFHARLSLLLSSWRPRGPESFPLRGYTWYCAVTSANPPKSA